MIPPFKPLPGRQGRTGPCCLSDLPTLVPVPPSRAPGQTVPVYGRSASFQAFDPNFATPYTQNLTLSVTRSLTRNLTLDVRYVGALTRKSAGTLNLNTSTALYNQELFDAFEAARRGENPELLDRAARGCGHCAARATPPGPSAGPPGPTRPTECTVLSAPAPRL